MTISDEDLAKLLYVTQGEAVLLDDYGEDSPASWDDLPEHEAEDQGENLWLPAKDTFRQTAHAARAALAGQITDDMAGMDLAAVIWQAGFIETEPPPLHTFRTVPEGTMRRYVQMAHAAHAALCPPVTPLAPGETVRVPDRDLAGWEDAGIFVAWRAEGALDVTATVGGSEVGITLALDAAGVRALIQAGRRWLVAQEPTDGA